LYACQVFAGTITRIGVSRARPARTTKGTVPTPEPSVGTSRAT
jgi:hypothetical protein